MSYLLYVRSAARDYRVPPKKQLRRGGGRRSQSRARATGRQEETGINLLKAIRKELCKQISPNKHFNEKSFSFCRSAKSRRFFAISAKLFAYLKSFQLLFCFLFCRFIAITKFASSDSFAVAVCFEQCYQHIISASLCNLERKSNGVDAKVSFRR